MQLSDYEIRALNKLGETLHENKWSNEGMVQLIELVSSYLNVETIQGYADRVGKTYNGIKKSKHTIEILGNKYVIDND
jgi:hypothetical protein